MYKFFLFRRRIDPILLSAGVAFFAVRLGVEIFIFGFFAVIGAYLIASGHRSLRNVDWTYAVSAVLYAAGAVVIGLIHGNFLEDLRWIGYPVILLVGVLLFPGVVLIKDPLRQIVLGARSGLLLAVVLGGFEIVAGMSRVGFGGNTATTAFVLVVVGILARIPVSDPMRFLPNSRLWFYLAAIMVVVTGTRTVFPIFALGFVLDLFALRREFAGGSMLLTFRSAAVVGLVGLITFSTFGEQVAEVLTNRFNATVTELDSVMESGGKRLTGLELRLDMWDKSVDLIKANPVIGVGGEQSMREIRQASPQEERSILKRFNHVHQFILDELRQRGLVGLLLMLGFFSATGAKLLRRGSPDTREATTLFLTSLLLYGSMHGLLVADRNMALIAIFLSMLLLSVKKEALWRRIHNSPQPTAA